MNFRATSDEVVERPRGILSEADRRYLLDPESYRSEQDTGPQSAYKRRKAIKNRIENSLIDFSFLLHCLEENDELEEFYNRLWWSDFMNQSAEHAIAFFYSSYRNWARDNDTHGEEIYGQKRLVSGAMSEQAIEQGFERTVGLALAKAYSKEGVILDEFDMEINTRETDGLEAVRERAESGDDVTAAEVGMLLDAGWITVDEYEELITEAIGELTDSY